MEALLRDIIQLLISVGPWIVLLVTATETAFFFGLLIPAEATVLVAAYLAPAGILKSEHVLLATIGGALLGDQIGYVLGRMAGRGAAARGGRLGRLWRRHEARATLLFQRRSLLAVTFARFISFVRTLMPWFAGMTRMPYGRFLAYDTLGVVGWGGASVAAGYAAGRSWHVVASALGTASTVIVLLLVIGGIAFAVRSRRRARALVRVALTGNVASGKSAVTEVWRRAGALVIDADDLARQAVEPGTEALQKVIRRFGAAVAPGGQLDRAALRTTVFADDESRRALEAIVHPEVERLRLQEERRAAAAGNGLVVHAIPLLFETGLDDRFDVIVVVDAPAAVRRERLVHYRGLSSADADALIGAQAPAESKRQRAHYVIDNAGTLEELEEQAEQVWAEIEARVE